MINKQLTSIDDIIIALRKKGELDEEKLKYFKKFIKKRKKKLLFIASLFMIAATYRIITQDEITTRLHGIDRVAVVYLILVLLPLIGLGRTYSPKLLKIYSTYKFTNAEIQNKRSGLYPLGNIAVWYIKYSYDVLGKSYIVKNAVAFRDTGINSILRGPDVLPVFLDNNKMPILYDPELPTKKPHIYTKKENNIYNLRKNTPNYSTGESLWTLEFLCNRHNLD